MSDSALIAHVQRLQYCSKTGKGGYILSTSTMNRHLRRTLAALEREEVCQERKKAKR